MLGDIAPDLIDALGVDVIGLGGPTTMFGFENKDWKPWQLFDGTPVLVPAGFNTIPEANGDIMMYPEGDKSVPPSGRMPKGGYYFDSIVRQPPIDDEKLNPEDNLQEFVPISDATLQHFAREADRLWRETDKAILANFGGTAFGDIALVPVPWVKHPRGIRDIEEWYVSTVARFDYVYEVFQRQCEIALANLAKIYDAVGDRVSAVFITGTDFGTQNGLFIGCPAYRKLFKPFHRKVNDWVHQRTPWKTFIHSCGSVIDLVPDLIEAGFDILNPVQCSAAGMDPQQLKDRFGDKITFWGGGVDTQKTLPFGTPEQIREEVPPTEGHFWPWRRIRVQHGPQRAGQHAGEKPRGALRSGPRQRLKAAPVNRRRSSPRGAKPRRLGRRTRGCRPPDGSSGCKVASRSRIGPDRGASRGRRWPRSQSAANQRLDDRQDNDARGFPVPDLDQRRLPRSK